MRRRELVAGLGSIAAGISVVAGSSAFTAVEANRTVSVNVASDADAFLRLTPLTTTDENGDPTGRSRVGSDGTVEFAIPGTGSGASSAAGIGVDSVYEFHDLLRIENQGTSPVEVYSEYGGSSLTDLALVDDTGVLRTDPPVLSVGDGIDVGLRIDTTGSTTGQHDATLTIVGE